MATKFFQDSQSLGKPPFRFVGVVSNPLKSLRENNPEAFNAAVRSLPKLTVGTTWCCAHCGTPIMTAFVIKSADSITFAVGETCVNKLAKSNTESDFSDVERNVKKHKREVARAKAYEKKTFLRNEMKSLIEELSDTLTAIDHPNAYYKSEGKTMKDYYIYGLNYSTFYKQNIEKLKAIKANKHTEIGE